MSIRSVKVQLTIFLGILAAYISLAENEPRFLICVAIAFAASVLTDTVINYSKIRQIFFSDSSMVTGMILGYVLSCDLSWWLIIIAAVVSIGSKHIVRLNYKHIFNPAAFGIVLLTLWFGIITQWKAAYMWYIMVPAGIYFSLRVNRLWTVLSYLFASLILYGSQSLLYNTSLLQVIGYLNYFFIFIIMTEPLTTPCKKWHQIIFGSFTALAVFAFYETKVLLEVELSALLMLNFVYFMIVKKKFCGKSAD